MTEQPCKCFACRSPQVQKLIGPSIDNMVFDFFFKLAECGDRDIQVEVLTKLVLTVCIMRNVSPDEITKHVYSLKDVNVNHEINPETAETFKRYMETGNDDGPPVSYDGLLLLDVFKYIFEREPALKNEWEDFKEAHRAPNKNVAVIVVKREGVEDKAENKVN